MGGLFTKKSFAKCHCEADKIQNKSTWGMLPLQIVLQFHAELDEIKFMFLLCSPNFMYKL